MSHISENMERMTLLLPKKKLIFFRELVKSLDFVQEVFEEPPPNKKQILDSISEGFAQVRQHREGKLKLPTAKQLLDEL